MSRHRVASRRVATWFWCRDLDWPEWCRDMVLAGLWKLVSRPHFKVATWAVLVGRREVATWERCRYLAWAGCLGVSRCDAPDQAPDGVSSGGATLRDCDCLNLSFSSFRADICIHMHNLCNNKNSFYICIIHTTVVAFIIFYKHILESLYLYYYISLSQNYTYKIRDCGTVR